MIENLHDDKKGKDHLPVDLCCHICGNFELEEYVDGTRRFLRCGGMEGCGIVFVHPECYLTPQKQSERYLLHRNILEPADAKGGYRSFLAKFADTVLDYMRNTSTEHKLSSIFDYGSGPEPALMQLLTEYKLSGRLADTTEIRGWDPFFAPTTPFFKNGADLVLCLEVAEHFENPTEGFAGLARASRLGGIVALQTMIVPQNYTDFKNWWYKEDSTHVNFYSKNALELCAKNAGLVLEAHINSVFFFRKIK